MSAQRVTFFEPYPFAVGQKINIKAGPRKGDWEVVAVDDKTVTLRCPFSGKQFTWRRFCYLVEEKDQALWPGPK